MKPWRERLAEARRRRELSREDRELWVSVSTCPAAEACDRFGLDRHSAAVDVLFTLGGEGLTMAILREFDDAEYILDLIEDVALELKRAQP